MYSSSLPCPQCCVSSYSYIYRYTAQLQLETVVQVLFEVAQAFWKQLPLNRFHLLPMIFSSKNQNELLLESFKFMKCSTILRLHAIVIDGLQPLHRCNVFIVIYENGTNYTFSISAFFPVGCACNDVPLMHRM